MLNKVSDLNQTFKSPSGNVIEWKSPGGWLYRYERNRGAVGMARGPDSFDRPGDFEWYVLSPNTLTAAKRRVFDLINEDEF